MIKVGDALPTVTFQYRDEQGSSTPSTETLFNGQKVVLFAVPGAFTPTCSNQHLPGYIQLAEQFYAKGVDRIICLSVNDSFVMYAWGLQQGSGDKVMMLADGGAAFTKAIALDKDTGDFGGIRSQRYAMIVDDGVVSYLALEPAGSFGLSSAETLLAQLD